VTSAPASADRSYRALLAVPWLGRIILAMQIARIAQSMVGLALVLFTLGRYHSPFLTGIVTLASILPGLHVSPIAGALLDRHGRMRLVRLDYLVALLALVLVGSLAILDRLPPWLLIAITMVSSLTAILSQTGLRSLFPLIVPEHLWERVNAIDSNGYVVATIIGPPLAAGLVGLLGGPVALLATGGGFGLAALAMIGIPEPLALTESKGHLLGDALDGLRYAWRNRTIRGLGLSISVLNLAGGITTIVVPLTVLDRLGFNDAVVGVVFAVSGVTGMISALAFGRLDSRGREWRMLVVAMVLTAPAIAFLLPPAAIREIDPALGLGLLLIWAGLSGLVTGPLDIALFTVRQRRTDPAWMGRAFAVSMAFNFIGFPIGAAVAGVLASASLGAAVGAAIGACLLAALFAATMIPRSDEDAAREGSRAPDRQLEAK
jgi:MFS family permease